MGTADDHVAIISRSIFIMAIFSNLASAIRGAQQAGRVDYPTVRSTAPPAPRQTESRGRSFEQ
jgi:hypothetical protein